MDRKTKTPYFRFLEGLASLKQKELLKMLKTLWTHHPTEIEGYTLSLSETDFILSEGLIV